MRRLFALCFTVFIILACSEEPQKPARHDPEVVAMNHFGSMGDSVLSYLVKSGHFSDKNIEPELYLVQSGEQAIDMMLQGNLDFAIVSPFIFVKKVLEGADIRYLATFLASNSPGKIIFLNDTKIETFKDLEGLRLGIPLNTQYEFYTEYFLTTQDIDIKSITFINIDLNKVTEKLQSNEIDFALATEPEITTAKAVLGNQYGELDINFNFLIELGIAVPGNYDKNKAITYLSAYKQAISELNADLYNNPDRAATILGFPASAITTIKTIAFFDLALNRTTLLNAESEARWLLLKDEYKNKKMPDIDFYLDDSIIKEVNK